MLQTSSEKSCSGRMRPLQNAAFSFLKDEPDLSTPHIDGAVSSRGVDVAVTAPFHTADSLGVAGHRKQAPPGVSIPHLNQRLDLVIPGKSTTGCNTVISFRDKDKNKTYCKTCANLAHEVTIVGPCLDSCVFGATAEAFAGQALVGRFPGNGCDPFAVPYQYHVIFQLGSIDLLIRACIIACTASMPLQRVECS